MSRKRMGVSGKVEEFAGRRFIILRSNDVYERLKSGQLVRVSPGEVKLARDLHLRAQQQAQAEARKMWEAWHGKA